MVISTAGVNKLRRSAVVLSQKTQLWAGVIVPVRFLLQVNANGVIVATQLDLPLAATGRIRRSRPSGPPLALRGGANTAAGNFLCAKHLPVLGGAPKLVES